MLKKKAKKKVTKKAKKKSTAKKTATKKVTKKKKATAKKTAKKKVAKKKTKSVAKKKVSKKAAVKKQTPKKANAKKKVSASKKTPIKKKTSRKDSGPRKIQTFPGETVTKIQKGKVEIDKRVPDFSVSSTGDKAFSLADYSGKKIVLYFYPKDSTPGCTIEGNDFTKLHKEFKKHNTEIFGISKDSLKSHFKFIEKQNYSFELLSDGTEKICNLFKVMKEKNMYGRKYFGIERSTFLISEDGKLLKEWRGLKVPGHADEVLKAVKELA